LNKKRNRNRKKWKRKENVLKRKKLRERRKRRNRRKRWKRKRKKNKKREKKKRKKRKRRVKRVIELYINCFIYVVFHLYYSSKYIRIKINEFQLSPNSSNFFFTL
jgi:hypothetical protein